MIGYYAHHQGSGHLTRMQSIAGRSTQPVTGISSVPAPDGWTGDWLRLPADDTAGPVECQDVTAGGVLHWAPRHHDGMRERTAALAAWAANTQPDLVVVDVSVEVALTLRLCGVPVVVAAMPGHRLDRAHAIAYDLADRLLAPWPEGAHRAGWPQAWLDKTWHVGGISRFEDERVLPPQEVGGRRVGGRRVGGRRVGGRRVFVLWGTGGRGTTADQVAAAQDATPGWEWVEASGVDSGSAVWAELSRADVVVTHAGQNAVAEVAAARRPAVVVAQPRPHDEQAATAAAVERLGLAVGLPCWPEPSAWPGVLERAHDLGGDGWGAWGTDGAARAARLLSQRAQELMPVRVAS